MVKVNVSFRENVIFFMYVLEAKVKWKKNSMKMCIFSPKKKSTKAVQF